MEDTEANPGPSTSYGIEETSPDLLKNTPSNIARLEDVIEQCSGRQKYLAQTNSPSDGRDVRWYFCKVPLAENELAASIPQTAIVGKGDYFRFGMRDSLALEASFLQREEDLLSCWWKEYAECSEGPRSRSTSIDLKLDTPSQPCLSDSSHSTQLSTVEEERVGVPVKGGLYEADLAKRHCFPVYWNGENRRVLRGHWFARKASLDWLPLREDVAEQLEFAYRGRVWHRRTFQPSGLFAARIDLQGSTSGLHALFTGEDDTWEAWLSVEAHGFTNIMSLKRNAIKLRRGYAPSGSPKPSQDELRQQKEEEMDDYCSQVPVRHLVFMVHGIGQRLEKANLVDDVGNFRQITASLAELHLTSYQRDTQRVLFIPCQWRRGLKLGGESVVEKITLDGVKGLRVMLSATAHDVLYYMSPIYCQEIINSVSNQLNWLYLKFIKRNPGYDGKVSIYGHSLGSVLSYDILCHQNHLSCPFPLEFMFAEHAKDEKSHQDGTAQPSEVGRIPKLGNENSITKVTNIEEHAKSENTLPDDGTIQSSENSSSHLENEDLNTSTSIYEEHTISETPQPPPGGATQSSDCSFPSKFGSECFDRSANFEEHAKGRMSELDGTTQSSEHSSPSDLGYQISKENFVDLNEHEVNEKTENDIDTQSSDHSSSNPENENTNNRNLDKGSVDSVEGSDHLFQASEDPSPAADNSSILDGQNDLLKAGNQEVEASSEDVTSPKQSSESLLNKGSKSEASSGMHPQEENQVDSANGVGCAVSSGDSDNWRECEDRNNKDRLVQLLTEEIRILKARVAELELDHNNRVGGSHRGDEKAEPDSSKQAIPQIAPKQATHKSYTPYIKYTKLEFEVDTFFAVGSPLGVFLALRNIRIGIGKGKDYWQDESIHEEMPACQQMFNIFHPFDPVAYSENALYESRVGFRTEWNHLYVKNMSTNGQL
ncbi:hypothetical protein Syun_002997 [Stephania yunnanensis]|uniref:DDHD domain-containing protein n=1 Tax=Stephania yunnanensis TaxID=152371 RepID=A0AAP0L1E8_9MAGN